jgi:hypothetical protein
VPEEREGKIRARTSFRPYDLVNSEGSTNFTMPWKLTLSERHGPNFSRWSVYKQHLIKQELKVSGTVDRKSNLQSPLWETVDKFEKQVRKLRNS